MSFVRFHARLSVMSARPRMGKGLPARLLCGLSVAMAGLTAVSCGSGHAILQISAPSSAVAGSPFTITVTALYDGNLDTIINLPIRFTSSDSSAVLPPIYAFTSADAGSHTFTNGVTLMTPGNQSITATAPNAPPITGTVNVMVSAANSDR
jgi:hypothetical protein